MIFFKKGLAEDFLTAEDLRTALYEVLDRIGHPKRVLAIPPDYTRLHSQAGFLTELTWEYYQDKLTDILPAIGTHFPMTDKEIESMFGKVPKSLFRVHDWRKGFSTLGEVPAEYVHKVSEGRVDYSIPIQVDRLLTEGKFDLILSIGQVVPHEVAGMASYNKNIFIGTGGSEAINKTHFLGAVYGLERVMGRVNSPVRSVLNFGSDHFARHLPVIYTLTVIGKDSDGKNVAKGLFIGDDIECFNDAAELSIKVNLKLLDKPLRKVIVYLDPSEYKSTWLGNKSIYRTRMAIADGGELIVLAPGLTGFGEDETIDKLIRKYGYQGTASILEMIGKNPELTSNLSVAAHLIHGSTEERFSVVYCPGRISRDDILSVNFQYGDVASMSAKYNPRELKDGFNIMPGGEEIFYISNPALGLWALKERF